MATNMNHTVEKLAQFLAMGIVLSLLTTVAGINIFVLLLLPLGAWAWRHYRLETTEKKDVLLFFGLIFALCFVDVISNLNAGHESLLVLRILLSDLRTFIFIVILWPLFARVTLSKLVLWGLVAVVTLISTVDLMSVLLGGYHYVLPSSGANMNGQMLVALFFVLAQLLLVYPSLSWRAAAPMGLMLAGLFLASHRRTGWILMIAGAMVWIYINRERLINAKYQKWLVIVGLLVVGLIFASPQFDQRVALIGKEASHFIEQTTEERISKPTSVGVRLQYALSSVELIRQSGWLGVGSLSFKDAFWRVNGSIDGLQSQYSNPHNEYLYMYATKGPIGLILYVLIFWQACRIAKKKINEVQRKGILVIIFLFMLSVTTNSMVVDMKEGHFAMLMMLVFLAPRELNLLGKGNHS
jgi:O-antigen ligase